MGKSKKPDYTPKPYKDFESSGYLTAEGKHKFKSPISNEECPDSITKITMSMLRSPAFIDLTAKQQGLYLRAKSQYESEVDRPYNSKNQKIANKYKGANQKLYFYLNHKLLVDVFQLYGKNSNKEMYRDIAELVKHGFIVPVEQENHQRTIYKFSSEWINWNPYREYKRTSNDGFIYEWVDKF